MPELPDLEAYAENLRKMLSGKAVRSALVFNRGKSNVDTKELNAALASAKIAAVARNGKEMFFSFDNGRVLSVHLMLEGKFHVTGDINDVSFKIFGLQLDGNYLVVTDPKGWAKITLDPQPQTSPDALSPDFSFEYLWAKLNEKKSKNIKSLLIDQSIVRGIGNAYVDEILWEAKVSPDSRTGAIPIETAKKIYNSALLVLKRSVNEILRIDPDVIHGEIRDFMRVHNKKRSTCPHGFHIHTKRIASKITYYTDEQVVYS